MEEACPIYDQPNDRSWPSFTASNNLELPIFVVNGTDSNIRSSPHQKQTPMNSTAASTRSPSAPVQELAKSHLGVTYDPIRKSFGRTCVLDLKPSAIRVTKPSPQEQDEFSPATHAPYSTLGDSVAHYPSSPTYQTAAAKNSEQFVLRHVVLVATISSPSTTLSPEMTRLIQRLPPWSAESKVQYDEFFENYGTHVVTKIALGGVLRIIVTSTEEAGQSKKSTANRQSVITTSSSRVTKSRNVLVFRDGGASVAEEVTRVAEHYFTDSQQPPEWDSIRDKWITALEHDPVFCPDDPNTECRPLYMFGAITSEQRANLERALEAYLGSHPDLEKTPIPKFKVSVDSTSASLRPRSHHKSQARSACLQRVVDFIEVIKSIFRSKALNNPARGQRTGSVIIRR
ncbi:hypothetical protein C8R45DRAFT_1221095 [Mycena sanguinolenta]|nr:hypothetical protein C8R45DRAFT_1221095 [Mycena sanguinolenta]